MSNTQAPNGLQFWRKLTGSALGDGQEGTPFKIAYNNSTAIGFGDPVIQLSTGYIGRASTGGSVAIKGIFVGCQFIATSNNQLTTLRYWPGSGNLGTGDVQAWIISDPDTLWTVQAYNTAISFADIGANANIQIGTVNTTTGFSGASIDQSTVATTNTLPFRIYGLLSQYQTASGAVNGTDDASAYNVAIVKACNWDRAQLEGI